MKDFHQRCLTARRPLRSSESKASSHVFNVFQVKDEILEPLSCSAAESDRLGRLIVTSHSWVSVKCSRGHGSSTYVKPSVGKSLYLNANFDRLWITLASFGRIKSNASRIKIKSALSVTYHANQIITYNVVESTY